MSTARDRYLQALDLFSAEARAGADRLGLQSACADWSIADVIRHVTGVQAEYGASALLGGAEGDGLAADHSAVSMPGSDFEAVETWEELAARLRSAAHDAHEDAFEGLPLATLDMALHAWDIRWGSARVGLASNLEFPAGLLTWMEDYRERADEAILRTPSGFGAAIEPPADATRSERFAAWTGREPRTGVARRADRVPSPADS